MSARLVDHLHRAREYWFVGREAEQLLFLEALAAAEAPFYVLHIFGPGGIGKSTLLRRFIALCDRVGAQPIYLDGHSLEQSPNAFVAALKSSMDLSMEDDLFEALASRPHRHVIFLDTYEGLASLDSWLRDVFLPQLPENVLVVLAGRDPLSEAWRRDPGWQILVHRLPLRNLSPKQSRSYLNLRQIPSARHRDILDFTHGHPLALSLVAELCTQRADASLQPEAEPDIIRALLKQFVQKVPSPAHRAALEACALVRLMTEALLAGMLQVDEAPADPHWGASPFIHELFEWLLGLSFIDARPQGLSPHDLAREVLAADLRWRNPDWYAELHDRARAYYAAHLERTQGQEQKRLLFDYIYLHRHNPVVRPFFDWQEGPNLLTDALRADDRSALLAMVRGYEGEASAYLAGRWLAQQPEGVTVFRDAQQQPAGFLSMVALQDASTEDLEADPGAGAAWQYLQARAPLRPGERATLFRFWMAREGYQSVSPVQSQIFVNMVLHYLTTPALAFTFLPCADPDFWASVFAYADLTRIPEADFEVGGKHYSVYGHDWRATPPAAWLALLAERETASAPEVAPPSTERRLLVLSEAGFAAAVHQALRDFTQPARLNENPLAQSRIVVERAQAHANQSDRGVILQAMLLEATEALKASPRQMKLYRALYHTYLAPALTQEIAAARLDLPISTYRRHLRAGIRAVTEILWGWEVGGPEK